MFSTNTRAQMRSSTAAYVQETVWQSALVRTPGGATCLFVSRTPLSPSHPHTHTLSPTNTSWCRSAACRVTLRLYLSGGEGVGRQQDVKSCWHAFLWLSSARGWAVYLYTYLKRQLSIYRYTYMNLCSYIYVNSYIYMYISIYIYVYMYIFICVNMYIHTYVYKRGEERGTLSVLESRRVEAVSCSASTADRFSSRVCICINMCIYMYMCTYICMYIYMCIYIKVRTYVYICICLHIDIYL